MKSATKPKITIVIPTDSELAKRRTPLDDLEESQFGTALRYVRSRNLLVLTLKNGAEVSLPIHLIPDLKDVAPTQLTRVRLSPVGDALELRELDIDIYVPGIIRRILGFDALQRRAGSTKTPAKAAAARANGAKGGRPRKTPVKA
jgi:hypothetical protein